MRRGRTGGGLDADGEVLAGRALTLVVSKSASVPDVVTAGLGHGSAASAGTIQCQGRSRGCSGAPITGTSANASGSPGLTNAAGVGREFGDAIDFVLDGGDTPGGVASTIVDFSGGEVKVLREGGSF